MKRRAKKVLLRLLAWAQEPSTWKGLTMMVTSAGWWSLEPDASPGELTMQTGMFIVGALSAILTQQRQYGAYGRDEMRPGGE